MHPVEGTAQLSGQGRLLFGGKAAAIRQRFAAGHAGPQTAVGKTVGGCGVAEMMGELGFCDVTHQADMSRSSLDRAVAVVGAKIAAIPGAAEQRGELAGFAAEDMEHGRELLREQEETAIGGGLLIAQRMKDGIRCECVGCHSSNAWQRATSLLPPMPGCKLFRTNNWRLSVQNATPVFGCLTPVWRCNAFPARN